MSKPPTFKGIIVRGMYHRGEWAVAIAKALRSGEYMMVEREPTNPYDGNAIKVLAREDVFDKFTFIGYIGREYAARIAPWMDSGWFFNVSVERLMNGYPIVKLEPMFPDEKKEEVGVEAELDIVHKPEKELEDA